LYPFDLSAAILEQSMEAIGTEYGIDPGLLKRLKIASLDLSSMHHSTYMVSFLVALSNLYEQDDTHG